MDIIFSKNKYNSIHYVDNGGWHFSNIKSPEDIEKKITENPKFTNHEIASVNVKFDEKYLEVPGMLFLVLQKLTLQNINLIELASTCTEFILYIEEKNVRLAFNTLHQAFRRKM